MAEYIEREALLKFIENGINNPDRKEAFGYDAVEILEKVQYMPAADVAPVRRWIPCSERLPEKNDQWVLCLCVSGAIEVLKFDYTMWNWDAQYPGRCYMENYVTHWMPIPQLPKEVQGNEL